MGGKTMAFGKTIELFLVNGTPESLVTAELSNWNGKAIKIPRNEVQGCTRDDIKGAGVYFLFCQEEDGTDSVYIGEAENVQDRLVGHLHSKEDYYWNTAVIFIGRDLNKAHIRYLENRLVSITKECNRVKVLTKNTYQKTVLKESQIATLEEFIENIKVLINTLGYRILIPMPQVNDSTVLLRCHKAKGFISAGGLTVLKGSVVNDHDAPSFHVHGPGFFKLRHRLFDEGIISPDFEFTMDYEFSSPSAASAVVLGRISNGLKEWKTNDGKKLKDL